MPLQENTAHEFALLCILVEIGTFFVQNHDKTDWARVKALIQSVPVDFWPDNLKQKFNRIDSFLFSRLDRLCAAPGRVSFQQIRNSGEPPLQNFINTLGLPQCVAIPALIQEMDLASEWTATGHPWFPCFEYYGDRPWWLVYSLHLRACAFKVGLPLECKRTARVVIVTLSSVPLTDAQQRFMERLRCDTSVTLVLDMSRTEFYQTISRDLRSAMEKEEDDPASVTLMKDRIARRDDRLVIEASVFRRLFTKSRTLVTTQPVMLTALPQHDSAAEAVDDGEESLYPPGTVRFSSFTKLFNMLRGDLSRLDLAFNVSVAKYPAAMPAAASADDATSSAGLPCVKRKRRRKRLFSERKRRRKQPQQCPQTKPREQFNNFYIRNLFVDMICPQWPDERVQSCLSGLPCAAFGGDRCAYRKLPASLKPQYTPVLMMATDGGTGTPWHVDGHGFDGAGHLCIHGENVVMMMRCHEGDGRVIQQFIEETRGFMLKFAHADGFEHTNLSELNPNLSKPELRDWWHIDRLTLKPGQLLCIPEGVPHFFWKLDPWNPAPKFAGIFSHVSLAWDACFDPVDQRLRAALARQAHSVGTSVAVQQLKTPQEDEHIPNAAFESHRVFVPWQITAAMLLDDRRDAPLEQLFPKTKSSYPTPPGLFCLVCGCYCFPTAAVCKRKACGHAIELTDAVTGEVERVNSGWHVVCMNEVCQLHKCSKSKVLRLHVASE